MVLDSSWIPEVNSRTAVGMHGSMGLSGGIGQGWNKEIANEAAEVERVASAVFKAMIAA